MNLLKRIWHDPVWSKIIASLILISVVPVGAYLLNLWPLIIKSIYSVIDISIAKTSIPNWIFALLTLLSVSFIARFIVIVWKRQFPKKVGARSVDILEEAVAVTDENDIKNILKDWLKRKLPSSRLIYFSKVDKECHFLEGTAKKHTAYIKKVARELGCNVATDGNGSILFESSSRTGV